MKLVAFILKNLLRNKVRSLLTILAAAVLVACVTMILTVLHFIEQEMSEKENDVKLVVTERYRMPSRFDRRLVKNIVEQGALNDKLREVPGFQPDMHTTWHFIVLTLDPEMKDSNKEFMAIATIPEKMPAMVDGLKDLDPELCLLLKQAPLSRKNIGMLMGPDLLADLHLRVGDVIRDVRSPSHRDGAHNSLKMDFEIVGVLPATSRWVGGAFLDKDYLDETLHDKKCALDGKVHLLWLQVSDLESAGEVARLIEADCREIKCETASSAVSRYLGAFQTLFWGVKFVLVPVIVAVLTAVVANAISITVRERTTEIAVLKVLGFPKPRILALVLGEGLSLGFLGGLLGSGLTFFVVNLVYGGLKLDFGYFPVYFVPAHAFWWGPAAGAVAAFLGGAVPSWNACSVKVSEVFAQVI